MFAKLWNDEAGNVAVEYLFLLSIIGLGLVVAFSNLENAIKTEYTELGSAILGLSQAYAISTEPRADRCGSGSVTEIFINLPTSWKTLSGAGA